MLPDNSPLCPTTQEVPVDAWPPAAAEKFPGGVSASARIGLDTAWEGASSGDDAGWRVPEGEVSAVELCNLKACVSWSWDDSSRDSPDDSRAPSCAGDISAVRQSHISITAFRAISLVSSKAAAVDLERVDSTLVSEVSALTLASQVIP